MIGFKSFKYAGAAALLVLGAYCSSSVWAQTGVKAAEKAGESARLQRIEREKVFKVCIWPEYYGINQALSAGVVFYQKGEFTSPVIAGAAEALKSRLQESGVSGPVTRKLFSTFVEMAQNIHHYAAPVPESGLQPPVGSGTITIVKSENDYSVICVNRIHTEQIPRISEKLDQVRSMSLEEIKKAYREQLHNNAHSQEDALSKGAGLGWLTVARDARQPLDYSFTTDPLGEGKFAFFSVRAVI